MNSPLYHLSIDNLIVQSLCALTFCELHIVLTAGITTTTTYVDVAQGSDLVLVCAGTAPVSWSDHTAVSSQREVITNPSNNAGEQRSWLIYRNAANSGSAITCSTGNGSCINYAVKVFSKCKLIPTVHSIWLLTLHYALLNGRILMTIVVMSLWCIKSSGLLYFH